MAMRKIITVTAVLLCAGMIAASGQGNAEGGPGDDIIVSGFKQALSMGTEAAVKMVSQTDGYFGNQLIKILMPEKMKIVADMLGKVGMQKQVDDFILSMNRAAEKAAPQAASIFADAITSMSFEDAKGLLAGGDTAATDFFKNKTSAKIYDAFKPIISASLNETGSTALYNAIMSKYNAMPLAPKVSVDLEDYVTTKAMDGLFLMIGQEEKKIRTQPAARVTDLLKTVFGN